MIVDVIHLKLAILNNNYYIINMKPLNLDNRPCSPISSNCVIWQGPDIPCIKLCTGDTISDIVYKLGTELCTIMEQLNVSNYDLSCFNLAACPPDDFQALIQLLIDRICTANGVVTDTTKSTSGCPDCVVSVADCFVQGTTTTMQLTDYVQMIANRVCSIGSEIASINSQISVINNTLNDLQTQIDNLPVFTLPTVNINCLLTPGAYSLQVALDAIYNNVNGYCNLLAATGNPSDIVNAVQSQCVVDGDLTLSNPAQTFAQVYLGTWIPMALTDTVADAINNIWIVLCDMYSYLNSSSITVTDTSSVNLDFTAGVLTAKVNDTGWKDLLGFDFYTGSLAKPQCRRIGNVIHFRGLAYIPLDNGSGSVVNLTADNSYRTFYQVGTFTGSGGITYDVGNRIVFNNDTSVIPASVLDAGTNLDGVYRSSSNLAVREIQVVDGGNTSNGYLTASVLFLIDSNKKLKLFTLDVLELNTIDTSTEIGMSALRYITSNVVTGNYLPDYLNAASELHSFTTSPAPASPDRTITSEASTNYQWPVTCNAGDRTQVGGFKVSLDGLIAYVDPCTLDIKNNECIPA
jgi:hypothetical protein